MLEYNNSQIERTSLEQLVLESQQPHGLYLHPCHEVSEMQLQTPFEILFSPVFTSI